MKGRGAKIYVIKIFEFENTRSCVQNVAFTEKKEEQYFNQIVNTNQGHLLTKAAPVIEYTNETVIHCDVPVIEKTFIDDFKQLMKMTNYKCKILQINVLKPLGNHEAIVEPLKVAE